MRPEYVLTSETLDPEVEVEPAAEIASLAALDAAGGDLEVGGAPTAQASTSHPLVSVVMPAYNVADWIPRSIDSVLAQTVSDLELVIVDDASSDNTVEVVRNTIEHLQPQDQRRVRLVCQPANRGFGPTFARGVQEARGRWIWGHDSDDFADPELLEKMLGRAQDTGAEIVVCPMMFANEQGTPLGTVVHEMPESGVCTGSEALVRLARGKLNGSQCNKLVRRSAWTEVFDPSEHTYADLVYTSRLFGHVSRVAGWSEPLYFYTQRTGSVTGELSPTIWDLSTLSDQVDRVFDQRLDVRQAKISKLFFRYRWVYWHMLHKAINQPRATLTPKVIAWTRSKIKVRDLAVLAASGSPGMLTVIILGSLKISPHLHHAIYRTYKFNARKREAQA